jgi:hypothetical protein
MVQKILDLALNLLSLLDIGSIGSSVWQTRSRNKVNLMLNPFHGWKSWRYLGGKRHYIPTKGGKVLTISLVENKTSLHIKA